MESIKAELERLSASGFKEIVLTGINLSCYDDNGKKLIDVIEMADNVNGIERIRLGSLDPEVVILWKDWARLKRFVRIFIFHFKADATKH